MPNELGGEVEAQPPLTIHLKPYTPDDNTGTDARPIAFASLTLALLIIGANIYAIIEFGHYIWANPVTVLLIGASFAISYLILFYGMWSYRQVILRRLTSRSGSRPQRGHIDPNAEWLMFEARSLAFSVSMSRRFEDPDEAEDRWLESRSRIIQILRIFETFGYYFYAGELFDLIHDRDKTRELNSPPRAPGAIAPPGAIA
ncbi:hypothetical protein ACFXG4_31855 [Nocardia sp. NPDC059246]|uniref:hypothetical protein n=1 Tax=unclassified Nocardia TaxID=2637762 RepID=UPI0036A264C9